MHIDTKHHVELVIYNDHAIYCELYDAAHAKNLEDFIDFYDETLAEHLINTIESPIAKEFTAAIYSNLNVPAMAKKFYDYIVNDEYDHDL